MVTSDFIQYVNDALRGVDDDAPVVGSDEYSFWVRTYNRVKNSLYEDVTKRWSNTYSVASLGAVVASAAPSYNLSATYLGGANVAYIVDTDGNRHEYEIIHPEEQEYDAATRYAYVAGSNPQKLYLTTEIEADETIVGGTMYLPGYYLPADLLVSSESDFINLPDPYWGVMMTAAEIAFSDITYEDKAPDLNAKANALFTQMNKKNRRGTFNNPRVTPTNVRRIPDTRRSG